MLSTNVTSRDRTSTFRYVAIIGAICTFGFFGVFAYGLQGHLPLPVEHNLTPLGRDFVNTWFYGRAFFDSDPGRFYDRDLYTHAVRSLLPADAAVRLWSYPPPLLMVAAPFGRLPYVLALALWTLSGVLALAMVVRQRGSLWLVAAALTSPVVFYGIVDGQISLFVAAVILTAFMMLDRRPVLAGLVLSLLLIKPQAGLLIPVLLVASGRWKVLISAAAGAVTIVALSIAVNGLQTWMQFIAVGLPAQMIEMKTTIDTLAPISVSVTTAAKESGLPAACVSLIQAVASGLAAAIVAWVGWRRKTWNLTTDEECLIVLTCTIFATPYFLIHDLVAFSTAALIVAYRDGLIRNRFGLLAMVYVPVLQGGLSTLHVYAMPFLAFGFAIWLVSRHRRTRCDQITLDPVLSGA